MVSVVDIEARLAERVPVLAGRIHRSADLSRITTNEGFAQVGTAAYVLMAGMNGGAAQMATGRYVQSIDRVLSVLLVWRAQQDNTIPDVETLIESTVAALAGWDPGEDIVGVVELARAGVLSFAAGTLVYQIDFRIPDQLRITP